MFGEAHTKAITAVAGRVQPASAGLPPFDMRGKKILEVGCATGVDLTHSPYAEAAERCGIDIDAKAIEKGRALYPALDLRVGSGEALPFRDSYFDAVLSRIALPYMDIPTALAEFNRVMRPGGYLFASWHDWKGRETWLLDPSSRALTWKRAADFVYITVASITYRLSGQIPPRPWNGTRETFQFRNHVPRILAGAGFVSIRWERSEHHLRTTARKPEARVQGDAPVDSAAINRR
jgi:ubiquinone/menaquinone biosynthesis C-methylase UbiE